MSRYYEVISEEDLKEKLNKLSGVLEEYSSTCFNVGEIIEKLGKDIKVRFDLENTYDSAELHFKLVGFQVLDGMPFWGFAAGGDWENPVFFIAYWDGKKIRGYVPTEGNPFNRTTMQAYGNDEAADAKDYFKRGLLTKEQSEKYEEGEFIYDLQNEDFDWEAIKKDIKERIKPR